MRQDSALDWNEVAIKAMDFMEDPGNIRTYFVSSQLMKRTPDQASKNHMETRVNPMKPVIGLEIPNRKDSDQYLWPLRKSTDEKP